MDYDEYRLWEIYWSKDLEYPRRAEYYSMGIMAEVRRPNVKNPSLVKIEDMRIKFKDKDNKTELDEDSHKTKTIIAKNAWLGAFGMNINTVQEGSNKPPELNIMRRKVRPNQA